MTAIVRPLLSLMILAVTGSLILSRSPAQQAATQTIHLILTMTDSGDPPLARHQRVVVTVKP